MTKTPLHSAVRNGDLEAVRRHLDSGVSVDLQGKFREFDDQPVAGNR